MNKKSFSLSFPAYFAASILSSAIILGGCAVGPDFEKPEPKNLPESWTEAVSGNTDEKSIISWWENFEDPTLTSLVERALENNFDARTAAARIQQARARLGVQVGDFFPSIDAKGSMSETGRGTTSTAPSYSAGLSASWEIDIFGGTRRELESRYALYEYALANKCATRLTIAAEVAKNYFTYRALQLELDILKNNLEIQKNTYNVTLAKRSAGFVSELDAVRSGAEVSSTSAQIPNIESQIEQTRHAIEYLLALPVDALKDELSNMVQLPEFSPRIPLSVPADLLERRPDIIMAELSLHSANANIGAAIANFFPRFYVTGNISYTAPNTADLFQKQYGSWSVGPSVSWNIFNAGQTLNDVRLQRALTEEAGVSWEDSIMSAIKEVNDYLVSTNKEMERLRHLNLVVEKYKKSFELSRKLYQEGEIEFLDLLDAQRSMLTAERTQIGSKKNIINEMIMLYKALGGGWDYERSLFYEDPKNEGLDIKGAVF